MDLRGIDRPARGARRTGRSGIRVAVVLAFVLVLPSCGQEPIPVSAEAPRRQRSEGGPEPFEHPLTGEIQFAAWSDETAGLQCRLGGSAAELQSPLNHGASVGLLLRTNLAKVSSLEPSCAKPRAGEHGRPHSLSFSLNPTISHHHKLKFQLLLQFVHHSEGLVADLL